MTTSTTDTLDTLDTLLEQLGREIRRRREALGLTQTELAERSQLTRNFLGSVEQGKRDLSLTTLLALAQGLHVDPAELFEVGSDISAAAGEAGRLFANVSDEMQEAILAILREIAKTHPK